MRDGKDEDGRTREEGCGCGRGLWMLSESGKSIYRHPLHVSQLFDPYGVAQMRVIVSTHPFVIHNLCSDPTQVNQPSCAGLLPAAVGVGCLLEAQGGGEV